MPDPFAALEAEPPGAGVDVRAFSRQFGRFYNYAFHYTKAKLRMDPLYPAVYRALAGRLLPLLDLGCGMGVNAFYLRQRGFTPAILGIDYDRRKIEVAERVGGAYPAVCFRVGDARELPADFAGDVTILDILQFFEPGERRGILEQAAQRAARVGGRVIIRNTIRDNSRRFAISQTGDWFAKLTFWMKDPPISYPTLDELATPFREAGFGEQTRPCWGQTRFNNYLLVFDSNATPGK